MATGAWLLNTNTHKRMVHWHEWDWETLAMPTTLPSEGERQPKTCICCQNGRLLFMKCIWNIHRMFQHFEPHTGVLIECIQPTLDTHAHIKMWCQQVTHEIMPQRNVSIYARVCSILLVRTVWAHSGVLSWNETPDPLIREQEWGTFHSDLFIVAAFNKQLTHIRKNLIYKIYQRIVQESSFTLESCSRLAYIDQLLISNLLWQVHQLFKQQSIFVDKGF